MLSLRPVATAAVHRAHPVHDVAAMLDAVAARDSIELDFELARLRRIARVNRHAETEE